MGTYRTAEVCTNGHVSTSSADTPITGRKEVISMIFEII